MLNSNRAVQQRKHRLAFRLSVAVSHGHGRLLMQRRDELRCLIRGVAVIDERLLQTFKARSRIGGNVFDPEVANGLDH